MAHNKLLDDQIAQLSTSSRQPGTLPSQPEKPHDTTNAIHLRSGLTYDGPEMPKNVEEVIIEELDVDADGKASISDKGKSKVADPPIVIKVPFPGRLKNRKVEQQFGKFLEVVKNLQVTVPFTELVTQVPSYAKFMKDILTRKRSFNEVETIAFTEECSALLQSKSPPKLKDPGSFSIPFTICTHVIDKALCDLGAIVSVMPYSVCEKVNMGHLKVTNVTLQMADGTVKRPLGVLEDVSVKIGKLFIPVDFIVLDIFEDTQIPIILGRPFLHTAGAIIDVKQGHIVDESMFDYWTGSLLGDPLEALIALDDFTEDEQVDYKTMKAALKGKEFTIEKDDSEQYPVIVNAKFDDNQLSAALLVVLKKNRKALGYSLDDLKGISPDISERDMGLDVSSTKDVLAINNKSKGKFKRSTSKGKKPNRGKGRVIGNNSSKPKKGASSEDKWHYCCGTGHWKRNCPKYLGDVKAGHVTPQCIEVNLVLNWEKCHFMVNEGIVLGHLVSDKGIQVDKAKVQKKELLAVVYALEKFRSYLLGSKVTIFSDHAALRYLFAKKEAKPRLLRWILLLQEFDLEIKDKKGDENIVADHLSRLPLQEGGDSLPIDDSFSDDILLAISNAETPWYADYANFIVGDLLPPGLSYHQKKRFLHDVKQYFWDDPYLFKECADGLYRRCIP
ncbi:uncharacterized protein LOC141651531 [Silene latifolia]|uniref:uncharacterized protein LOC141651531 n=1 Tax=Silene latifolia TaxID=37657 RepID=UPI003D7871EE